MESKINFGKRNKPLAPKSATELIHYFANGYTNYSKGHYKSEDNLVLSMNTFNPTILIAKYPIENVKGYNYVVFHKHGFGHYFDKSNVTIHLSKIHDDKLENYKQFLKDSYKSILSDITYFKRRLTNNKLKVQRSIELINDRINNFKNNIKRFNKILNFNTKDINIILKDLFIDKGVEIYYRGFDKEYYYIKNDLTAYNILHNKTIFTDNEKLILDSRYFYYTYMYNKEYHIPFVTTTIEDKINIYSNEDKRNIILNCKQVYSDRQAKLYELKKKTKIDEFKAKVIEYTLGNSYQIIAKYFDSDTLSVGIRLNNNTVYTSSGANVPLKHAELLYKFFKRIQANNTEYKSNPNKPIRIGVYKLNSIYKVEEEYYIRIGCHIISNSIIQLFIKTNNLNWNE